MTFSTQLSAAFAPIAAVYDSASVSRALTWAQSFVEQYCDRTFDLTTGYVDVVDPKPYRSARLTNRPVTNVQAVYALLPPQAGSWPTVTQTVSASGGTLASGGCYWVVTAVSAGGESVASNEVSYNLTGSTSSNVLAWGAVAGASSYNVYRGRSAGSENTLVANVTATTYTDTGAAGVLRVPTTGLVWTQVFNYTFIADTGVIYDTSGLTGNYSTGITTWPNSKGGLKVIYDFGYDIVPQPLIDSSCRLAQQYLENPTLQVSRSIGDINGRFSGSGGIQLNPMDKEILGRFADIGIS
jgi:hypothetical protein